MKFLFLGRAALPLRIAALLLLIQSFALSPFSPSTIPREKAGRHRCGCSVEDAASGKCHCAARRCCSCCVSRGENISPAYHQESKAPFTSYLSLALCEGQEELSFNSFGKVKFFLPDFTLPFSIRSIPLDLDPRKKTDNPALQPLLPPPKAATLSATFVI